MMVFDEKLKEELIKTEVELIELSFKISDKYGKEAVLSAVKNFYYYLCKAENKDNLVASMNLEHRKFTIDLTLAIPEYLLPKVMPIILGVK